MGSIDILITFSFILTLNWKDSFVESEGIWTFTLDESEFIGQVCHYDLSKQITDSMIANLN